MIFKNNTFIIINNGFLSPLVHLRRGLRQGCPLSLPLYVIQGEVTTRNVNQNKNIKGIKIPNKANEIQIQAILNTNYNHHKEQDTLDQFDTSFCINQAIATLNDNKLQINI